VRVIQLLNQPTHDDRSGHAFRSGESADHLHLLRSHPDVEPLAVIHFRNCTDVLRSVKAARPRGSRARSFQLSPARAVCARNASRVSPTLDGDRRVLAVGPPLGGVRHQLDTEEGAPRSPARYERGKKAARGEHERNGQKNPMVICPAGEAGETPLRV
jgi:hypothetical protein